jgi:hypothetical protein
MSSFLVFDSKGGEFEGPKASPTYNKYQNHKLKIFNLTSGIEWRRILFWEVVQEKGESRLWS